VEEYKQRSQHGERGGVITVPIIFHVIHNGENVGNQSNVSAVAIQAQIDQLNNDFRKASGTSGDNSDPVGADSELEFCLALYDPFGNVLAEPGIHRINRNDRGWSNPPFTTSYIQNTVKAATVWDSENYFNVWVANISGGILGYAQFPNNSGLQGLSADNGTAATDGVVILYSSLGSTEIPFTGGAPYNMGRTLTHEAGHYFGLRHIWGDANCGNDYCNDTPTQAVSTGGNCPSTFSCGSNDMTENYMDYSNDVCMNIFTLDQKARMQAVMNSSRADLGRGVNLCDPDAVFAAYYASTYSGCAGGSIEFTENSVGDGFTSYSWDFGDGNTSTDRNPTHTFTTAGDFTVTLTANRVSDSYETSQKVIISESGTFDHLNDGTLINELAVNEGGTSGYVGGNNSFQDAAKVEYFAEGAEGGKLGEVGITFAVATGPGAANVRCILVDDVAGQPGPELGAVNIPISSILTNGSPTMVDFGEPTLNGPFYVGIELNYTNGTTVAVYTNTNGDTNPVTAWEQWSDDTWHPFNDGTEFTWGWDVALAITAEVLCEDTQAPAAPVADFTVNTVEVCLGTAINFSDQSTNDPTSWSWNFGDGTSSNLASPAHTYTTAGTYTVTLTASNAGGADAETKTDLIVVNPLPGIPVITNGGGGALSASSTSSGTWQWYLNGNAINGANSSTYNAAADGDYRAEITDGNGCVSISATTTVVGTAVLDAVFNASIVLYPNPVTETLTLELRDQPVRGVQLSLIDIAGRELDSRPVINSITQIDMRSFSEGVYLLKLETADGKTAVRKIVKQQ
jgi:PKD repeat protein